MQPINVPCFLYFLRMNLVILSIFSGRLPDCLPLIHLIIWKWGWTKIFLKKISPEYLHVSKMLYLCSVKTKNNGLWCNGNTTDSGPVILGSNPGSPAIKKEYINRCVPFLVNGCFQTGARQGGLGLSLFSLGFNGGSACAISVSRLRLRVSTKSMTMRRGVRATRPVAPTSGTTGCLLSVFVSGLDYDLTKCQTKALRVPFLVPKYSLVDFVVFSGDSQNTHCCCMGNFSSFLQRLPAEAPFLVVPPS